MTIQYDGSNFQGWQVQANGRTVQGDIESAFSAIHPGQKITLFGSGRTDSGVHALAQAAHIKLTTKLPVSQLVKALNSHLERDVRIQSVEEIEDDFHARYSATAREYEYRLVKQFSPITRHFATELKCAVDTKLLDKCAELLKGKHDFTRFCKATAEVDNKICTVFSAGWQERDETLTFHIKANRFLQHMVRFLVGTMLEVARGRYAVEDFKKLVNCEDTETIVLRAPGQGLFLKKVYYDNFSSPRGED